MIRRFQWAVIEADLDPAVGSEQSGIRPVLVISNEDFNRALRVITVAPLTSTQRPLYPSEVRLPRRLAGQPLDSIILVHQVRTISKQRLRRQFGYLDDVSIQQSVQAALRDHFDLD